jgi:hypothetical protein
MYCLYLQGKHVLRLLIFLTWSTFSDTKDVDKTFLGTVGEFIPGYMASHSRSWYSSCKPLREPQVQHYLFSVHSAALRIETKSCPFKTLTSNANEQRSSLDQLTKSVVLRIFFQSIMHPVCAHTGLCVWSYELPVNHSFIQISH